MDRSKEIFDISGPVHLLTCFDWGNTFHRSSLAASLVKGVYILEKDRHNGRIGRDAHAAPWWERFHFQLHRKLVDDSDSSYFGAIFQLKQEHPFHDSSPHPPRFVIAFRGTIIKLNIPFITTFEDMKLNIKSVFDTLETSSRFRAAFKAVRETVEMEGVGPTKVWIAGHSLGASIAMLVGRNMAMSGVQLQTYLFNPPFIKFPLENMIKFETFKTGIRIASSLLKAGIAKTLNRHSEDPEEEDPFTVLSAWKPYVFVNRKDPICSEYIGYYEHREKMDRIGVGKIERIATRYSIVSVVSGVILGRQAEPYHRLPTAYMTVNISQSGNWKQAHGIHQWWRDHSQWESKLYKFN